MQLQGVDLVTREKIAEYLSKKINSRILKELILIVNYSIKSIRDEKSKDDIGLISIIFDNNKTEKLEDLPTLLASIKQQENEQYIAIYAPINWESDKNKKELRKAFEIEIKDLITDCLKNREDKNGY